MSESQPGIAELIGQEVVLDTAGPTTYLGTLREIRQDGFWLEDADYRDGAEGHVTKERYICEARQYGIQPNRRRLFVFARIIISVSALSDVVAD